MYNHTLNRERKCFTVNVKRGIKDCFKINGKERIIMPKKGKFVKYINYLKNKVSIYGLCRF